MSSFHFQIITLKNSHFEFLSSMSQFWPVFGRMAHLWLCCRRQQRTIVYICDCVADDSSGPLFISVAVLQMTAADYGLYMWLCLRRQQRTIVYICGCVAEDRSGHSLDLWLCCRRQQRTFVYICDCAEEESGGPQFISVTVVQTKAVDHSLYLWLCYWRQQCTIVYICGCVTDDISGPFGTVRQISRRKGRLSGRMVHPLSGTTGILVCASENEIIGVCVAALLLNMCLLDWEKVRFGEDY